MDREFNIIIGQELGYIDYELFQKPLVIGEKIDYIYMDGGVRWPDVLAGCGIFKSKSDAKRNGWDKDIDDGWNYVVVGKLKKEVAVFKMSEALRDNLRVSSLFYLRGFR